MYVYRINTNIKFGTELIDVVYLGNNPLLKKTNMVLFWLLFLHFSAFHCIHIKQTKISFVWGNTHTHLCICIISGWLQQGLACHPNILILGYKRN